MHRSIRIFMLVCGVGLFGVAMLSKKKSDKLPVAQQGEKLPVVKKDDKAIDKKPPRQEEAKPDGALSFWCGEIIIGEGPHRGKIELVGHEGRTSGVLIADKASICSFDAIAGMKGDMIIRLRDRGQAPMISSKEFEGGKEQPMHPVYEPSEALKAGKLTPRIAPHIVSPATRKTRQKGQQLEGFTWHMASYNTQVYGHPGKKDDNANYASTAIEFPPSVKVILERSEIDLSRWYFTEADLVKMSEADRKFDDWANKNFLTEHKTSAGVFRVVTSVGRQSIEPNAKYKGGIPMATIQLPNGKWLPDFLEIQKTLQGGKTLFLIGRHNIFKWTGDGKVERLVTFEGLSGRWAPHISPLNTKDGFVASYYLPVNKSSQADFGGLLCCIDWTWMFYQYDGDYGSWVTGCQDEGERIMLTLYNEKVIEFDTRKGTFTDK